jgi:hypothetical protein
MCDMKTKEQNTIPANLPILKPRQLTVTSRMSSVPFSTSCFPELRLNGKWLRDSGFESGQQVVVTCEKDLLVIRPLVVPMAEWGGEREYL